MLPSYHRHSKILTYNAHNSLTYYVCEHIIHLAGSCAAKHYRETSQQRWTYGPIIWITKHWRETSQSFSMLTNRELLLLHWSRHLCIYRVSISDPFSRELCSQARATTWWAWGEGDNMVGMRWGRQHGGVQSPNLSQSLNLSLTLNLSVSLSQNQSNAWAKIKAVPEPKSKKCLTQNQRNAWPKIKEMPEPKSQKCLSQNQRNAWAKIKEMPEPKSKKSLSQNHRNAWAKIKAVPEPKSKQCLSQNQSNAWAKNKICRETSQQRRTPRFFRGPKMKIIASKF